MARYSLEVRRYMTAPVETISMTATLSEAYERLESRGFSSLAAVEGQRLAGVLSRFDLLHIGRRSSASGPGDSTLELPGATVASAMSTPVATVSSEATVRDAAIVMLDNRFHRVFVTENETLAGVSSTRDLMAAVRDERDETIVGQHMSTPVKTFDARGPVGEATALLDEAGIGGVVVVEDGWPIGTYTQSDALHARELPPETAVEDAMSLSLVCVPVSMRMHRAAAQALRLGTRRLIAVEQDRVVGILSGLDFARCAAA